MELIYKDEAYAIIVNFGNHPKLDYERIAR